MAIRTEILNIVRRIYDLNDLDLFSSGLNGQTFKYGEDKLIKISSWNERAYGKLEKSVIIDKLRHVNMIKLKDVKTPMIYNTPGNDLAMVFEYDNGTYMERYISYLIEKLEVIENEDNFNYEWGKLLGEIHTLGQNNIDKLPTYENDYLRILNMCSDEEIKEIFQHLGQEINVLPKTSINYGILHGDPQPNNFIQTKDELYAIDFDNMFKCFYVHDIAIGLEFAFENIKDIKNILEIDERIKIYEEFIKGYVTTKTGSEKYSEIDLFLRYRRAMRFIGLYKLLEKDSNNFDLAKQKILKNEKIL